MTSDLMVCQLHGVRELVDSLTRDQPLRMTQILDIFDMDPETFERRVGLAFTIAYPNLKGTTNDHCRNNPNDSLLPMDLQAIT